MMSQIVNLNESISEQRFIDININDNEDQYENPELKAKSTHSSDNGIKSIFNFINNGNNDNKKVNLKKLNSTELPYKTFAKKPLVSSLSVPPTSFSKTTPKNNDLLNIVINSSECSDDDEDDDDLMHLNDEKLIELNRNVKSLMKNNFLASPSFSSLKETDYDKDLSADFLMQPADPHSTPMRYASTSTIICESHDTNDELHGNLNSLMSDSDTTLSLTECNHEVSSDSSHNKSTSDLKEMLSRNDSIVDGLLGDIYDRFNISLKENFNESDGFTDLTVSSYNCTESKSQNDSDLTESNSKYNNGKGYLGLKSSLKKLDLKSLNALVNELTLKSNQTSAKLIRQLRQKDKLLLKLDKNCDILTSILQARSLKRRIDTQMKFTIDPMPGEAGFIQWKDAMKALVRLPGGVPKEFRKSVWLNLSKHYINEINLDWNKVRRAAFNDRSNPDDHELGIQIVKDLHRTGCSGFSGSDNEQDRALLKRVLLAFARYNKLVGYCQGFNIIAAQILEIVDKKEEDALMCMIYLIDHVLPEGYFTNSMHTLAIDMAVFRELLKQRLPKLCQHLNALQFNAITESSSPMYLFYGKKSKAAKNKTDNSAISSSSYEPPLTNVFTMQWYLTLFATCLPKDVLLRVWDCLFLEGAEILFRTSIAIWDKLSVSVMKATSADSFYSMMSVLTVKLFEKDVVNDNDLMNKIYSYGPFPLGGLEELREKLTFNINPFQQASSLQSSNRRGAKARSNALGLSNLKLNSADKSGNEEMLIDDLNPKPKRSGASNDDLDLSLRTSMEGSDDKSKRKYYYDEENDDDEVEDLAKMISCFALLMPSRQISASASNLPSGSTRNDIIIHAAAAASAYGSKLITSNKSQKEKIKSNESTPTQQKLSDDVSSVTPGAFSYISQMYSPKPLGDQLTSDLSELKKQYKKLKERQQQAHIIVQAASDHHRRSLMQRHNSSPLSPKRNDKLSVSSNPGIVFGPIESPKNKLNTDAFAFTSSRDNSQSAATNNDSDANITPVVNHLLIKPSDSKCNTVKQSITLVNPTAANINNYADSYIDIEKNINSLNHECINMEKMQSQQKKQGTNKKPYYSDDSDDDDDDDDEDTEDELEDHEEVNNNEIPKDKDADSSELENKDKTLVRSGLIKLDRDFKSQSSSSDSSDDECFVKETNGDVSMPQPPGPNVEQLKKKLSNESKLVIKHLVKEEKRSVPFNPFPMRQINSNVAKNGMRLGLYK